MRTRPLITALLAVTVVVAGCGQTAGAGFHSGTRPSSTAPRLSTPRREAKRHAAKTKRAPRRRAARRDRHRCRARWRSCAVKGRAPKTGYSREQFGDGWVTTDGCDTRDRILTRDLTAMAYLDDCRVESGTLADPYTAARIRFTRGGASEVDIDHVVALSDACWPPAPARSSPGQAPASL